MKKLFFTLMIAVIVLSVQTVSGQSIQIVTEDFPPYTYEENGKVTGVGTEVVEEVLKEVGCNDKIRVFPWARAYNMALTEPDTLIFTISRTHEREPLFKWVGIVTIGDNDLFSLKERTDIQIGALEDAKKYQIGTVREDVAEQYLMKKGFARDVNLQPTASYEQNLTKLMAKRIDLWAGADMVLYYFLKKSGKTPDQEIRKVYRLDEISGKGYYMAFSKKTSDDIVEKFRTALEKVRSDGRYQKIQDKYLH